jgi:hypothetical protein
MVEQQMKEMLVKLFRRTVTGRKGADVRPDLGWEEAARRAVSTDDTRRV